MYCDGIKLIKLNKKEDRKTLFVINDSNSDASPNVSDDDALSQKSQEIYKERNPQINANVLKNSIKEGDLLKTWENGGPIKLLKYQGDEAEGYLFFKNYKNFDYDKLKDLIHESGCTFLSMKEQANDCIKVRLKTECDVKLLYNYLKQDNNYNVTVLLDTEDFYNNKIKEKRIKKLAKFKYSTRQTNLFKTHGDLLSDVATANKLEADIRFHKPKGGVPRKKKNIPPKDPDVVDRKIQLENILRSRSKSPIIGTWQGHIIVLPRTPPPCVCSTKPSNSYEETNDLENSKGVNKLVDTTTKSLLKNKEVLMTEKNTIMEERKIVIKQSDVLTEFKSEKTNNTVSHQHKPTDEKFALPSSAGHSTSLKEQSSGEKDKSADNLSTRIQENRNHKCIHSSKYFPTDSSTSSDEEEIVNPRRSYESSGISLNHQLEQPHSIISHSEYFQAGNESSNKDELTSSLREGSRVKSSGFFQNSNFNQQPDHNRLNTSFSEFLPVGCKSSTFSSKVPSASPPREGSPVKSSISSNYRHSRNNYLVQEPDHTQSNTCCSEYILGECDSSTSSKVELASPLREGCHGKSYDSSQNSKLRNSRNNSFNQHLDHDHSIVSCTEYSNAEYESSSSTGNLKLSNTLRRGVPRNSFDSYRNSNYRHSGNNYLNQQTDHTHSHMTQSKYFPVDYESHNSSSKGELASPITGSNYSRNSSFSDSRNNSLNQQLGLDHSNVSQSEYLRAGGKASSSSNVEFPNPLREGSSAKSYDYSKNSRNNSFNQQSGHPPLNVTHSENVPAGDESSTSSMELASPLRDGSLVKSYDSSQNSNFRSSRNNSLKLQPDHNYSNISRSEYLTARDESKSSSNVDIASTLRRGGPRNSYGRSQLSNCHSRNNSLNQHSGHGYSNLTHSELIVGDESSSSSGIVELANPLREGRLLKSYDSHRNLNSRDSKNNAFYQSGHPHSNISHNENVPAGDESTSSSNMDLASPLREFSLVKTSKNLRDSRNYSVNQQPDHRHSNLSQREHLPAMDESTSSSDVEVTSTLRRGGPRSSYVRSRMSNYSNSKNNSLNQQSGHGHSNLSQSDLLFGYESSSSPGTVELASPLREGSLLKSCDSPPNSNFRNCRNNAFNQQSGHPHSNISHSKNVSAGDESSTSLSNFPSPLREGSFAKIYDYSQNFRDSRNNPLNLQPDHVHSNRPHRAGYASSSFSGLVKFSNIPNRGGPRSSHGSSQNSNRRHSRNNSLNQHSDHARSNSSS